KVLCPVFGAISALYVALADVWGLPYATEVSGTFGALIAFMGSIMQISSKTYWEENSVGSDIEDIEDGGLG
ncbi:MAG: phage holin, partial [Erysipelotrichaceae bacterium]|nr:phage holin [Erysipelotrichaceae bacterium]